jgi:hypothetical protein
MATVTKDIEDMKNRIAHLEKVLILGDGDRLPLAEIVRNLTNTVSDYIAQKDKEEQISQRKDDAKQAEWLKIRNIALGFIIPAAFVFAGQAIIFFFRIYPLLDKLSQ